MREMYEFGSSSSSSDGGGYYSDDHYNFQAMEYIEWPPAFRGGTVTLAVDSSPNLQEDQKNIQAKISSHHLYPMLLLSHIDCHKVGAPPEIVNMLDNIVQENDLYRKSSSSSNTSLNQLMVTDDSELDEFMATYCDVLAKFKSDLTMCFNESATFLNNVQSQLTNLCTTTNISEKGAEAVAEVEAEESDTNGGGEANNENELKVSSTSDEMCRRRSEIKDKLMGKYSGYITSLKHNFCKKNNKGKLPREATKILFNWWNTHYNWPYPTEVDKVFLAESTGLDPKQINNWFINQRKRHWKPSENMQFAVMETIHGHFSQ
ncbi:hypothetical protein BC332_08842 [Capsicum chinense]|nr:hypothetical protein BC332_08842 [Capsicum chinense]